MKEFRTEYFTTLYGEDSVVGSNGQPATNANPPDHRVGDTRSIVETASLPCCDQMKEAVEVGLIGFGTDPKYTYNNKIAEILIRKDGIPLALQALAYCPYCTAPITVRGIGTVTV